MAGFWDGYNSDTGAKLGVDQGNGGGGVGGFFVGAGNVGGQMATGLVDSVGNVMDSLGKGYGNALGEITGQNQSMQDSVTKSLQNNDDILRILRDNLAKETSANKKKEIQSQIDRTTAQGDAILAGQADYLKKAKDATDPGHILDNSAQLALLLATAGTTGTAIKGGETAFKTGQLATKANQAKNAAEAASTGLKFLTPGEKVAQALSDSKLGSAARAIVNPTSTKAGAAAFGGVGAAQGGLMTADTPGATWQDIYASSVGGGILGMAGGGLAGFFGSKGLPKNIPGQPKNIGTAAETQALDVGTSDIVKQMESAKATAGAAHMVAPVDQTPPALVINGDVKSSPGQVDLNPFEPSTPTPTPVSPQNVPLETNAPVVSEQMPLSTLGKAAEMQNPADAAISVPPTITLGAPQVGKTEILPSNARTISSYSTPKSVTEYKVGEKVSNATAQGGTIDGTIVKTPDFSKDLRVKGNDFTIKLDDGTTIKTSGAGFDTPVAPQASKTPKMSDSLPKTTNIGAEITPGQDILQANIQLTDNQVQQAVDALQGLSTKKKIAGLKAAGATDEQMRSAIGVDSNNVKLKPMEVVNQKPVDNPMDAIPVPPSKTSDVIDLPGVNKDILDWVDKELPTTKSTFLQKLNKTTSPITNTIDRATELLGRHGADTAQELVKATHYASNIKTQIRPALLAIDKQAKKLAGTSQLSRQELGRKLNVALENRTLGDKAFTTQAEKDIYNNIVSVLDNIKAEMVSRGIEVRADYTPYQMLKDFGESADYLSKGIEVAKTRVKSGHALPRKAESMGEMNDQNIIDLLPNYANGIIDHLAFSPVIKTWEDGLSKIPASVRRNTTNFTDGVNYLNKALGDMVNRSSSSWLDKGVQKAATNYYRGSLYMNPKNAMYSQLQKLQAVSETTHVGRKIANNLSKDTKNLIREKLWYSGYTMSQDVAEGMSQAKSRIGKIAQKYDINARGEESAVNQPFQWGVVDSLIKSDAYKVAKKAGMSEDDAIKAALKDPMTADIAEKSGNMVVSRNMFGANSADRPELLRGSGSLKRAFGMFMRFPMAESNFVKKIFTPKDSRLLEVLQSGDPRKIEIGERRFTYADTMTRLQEAEKGLKSGIKIEGAPDIKIIREQIKIFKKAVDDTDKVIKMGSNISSPKRAAAFTTMWLSSGAVATMWNGVLNYGNKDYKEKNYWENLIVQDPTLISKVAPWMPYSVPQSGLTSPLIPYNKYGPNAQGVMNLIPGGGIVNRASGQAISSNLSNWLKGK